MRCGTGVISLTCSNTTAHTKRNSIHRCTRTLLAAPRLLVCATLRVDWVYVARSFGLTVLPDVRHAGMSLYPHSGGVSPSRVSPVWVQGSSNFNDKVLRFWDAFQESCEVQVRSVLCCWLAISIAECVQAIAASSGWLDGSLMSFRAYLIDWGQ